MFVYVKVNAREGFKEVPRARRFWPAGQTLKVEIRDEEPKDVVSRNADGVETSAPPLLILGPESFEAIRKDSQNRFTIMSDLESQASISQESVQAARTEVQKLSGKVFDLDAENHDLKAKLAEAEKRIEALEDENDELSARLASPAHVAPVPPEAVAPVASPAPAKAPEAQTSIDDSKPAKGKGK